MSFRALIDDRSPDTYNDVKGYVKSFMREALVTGSAGLIGSEATKFFAAKGFNIVGIDNNMRSYFFGEEASTEWNRKKIEAKLKGKYTHYNVDIRDNDAIKKI